MSSMDKTSGQVTAGDPGRKSFEGLLSGLPHYIGGGD